MKLISSHETVNFLSQAAPRPWIHRLLRWMAFEEELHVYSRCGRIQPYGSVIDLTLDLRQDNEPLSGPHMDAAIKENFPPEIAEKLIGKEPFSRFDDVPYTWSETDDPQLMEVGLFLFASEIDWEAGVLHADISYEFAELRETFFGDSERFVSELEKPSFEGEVRGLSFEVGEIEMMLPSMQLGPAIGFRAAQQERRKPVGRPQKWDWEGAMAHVISQAQHPDGLPTGPGAQSKIETMISDWFVRDSQESPAPSQVRQRAAKIMETLKTPIND